MTDDPADPRGLKPDLTERSDYELLEELRDGLEQLGEVMRQRFPTLLYVTFFGHETIPPDGGLGSECMRRGGPPDLWPLL
jgi:hypothetical protein